MLTAASNEPEPHFEISLKLHAMQSLDVWVVKVKSVNHKPVNRPKGIPALQRGVSSSRTFIPTKGC